MSCTTDTGGHRYRVPAKAGTYERRTRTGIARVTGLPTFRRSVIMHPRIRGGAIVFLERAPIVQQPQGVAA